MTGRGDDPEVLVVGAGPTGLVLALWLRRLGVRLRLIEQAREPGLTSRALAVQARTLELYRQLGIADAFVKDGYFFDALNLWARGQLAGHVAFGAMGVGVSPYPHMFIFPQDQHERFLGERLRELGVEIERGVALAGFDDLGDRVVARLRGAGGGELGCECAFIAGCDGAHSSTREALGVGLPGGTYQQLFYVADVQASGAAINGELHVALDDNDFLAVFPMKGAGRARLVGTVDPARAKDTDQVEWSDVSESVLARMRLDIERVNWFSTYRVHHRVAEQFRRGRAFIVGDAAHIHSPVGGQGMNTGIGDAVNLAWKLADVLRRRAPDALLDSYQTERIAFARALVATTDRVFQIATRPGALAGQLRSRVIPALLPPLFRLASLRRLLFRLVSQTRISYRSSALSQGSAGKVHGGDRLPWVEHADDAGDNFAPLRSLRWQLHIYGGSSPSLAALCQAHGWPWHEFPWSASVEQAGLAKGGAYLLRPDGHVAWCGDHSDHESLARYAESRGLR